MAANLSVPRPTKCLIKNLEGGGALEAYFNPTKLEISKSVPWNKHRTSKGDNPVLEFTDAEPMNLSVELYFDTYEEKGNVFGQYIQTLQEFTLINPALERPPMCMFVWGDKFPSFKGVIESLAVSYTMFLSDGTPCRATANIKMKQASELETGGASGGVGTEPGNTVEPGDELRGDKYGVRGRQTAGEPAGDGDS